MFLHIKAKPNSKQDQLQRLSDGTLQVKVKAPAQDGKANEAIVKFLAEVLKISKSKINVVSGHTAPFKKLQIEADEEYVRRMLNV
jgi:uncharacterized protein (TIGR00251 family)